MSSTDDSDPKSGVSGKKQRREYLQNFSTIEAPSSNYEKNKSTFAYRLSESVFGSLLASYILGFIGAVAVYLQSPEKFRITSLSQKALQEVLSTPKLTVQDLAQLFGVERVSDDASINTLSRITLFPDSAIILQYLLISFLFSIFTAVVYFNYHQSILYLSSDQRKSSLDFLLSVLIGVCFGGALLFPMFVMFALGLLTLSTLFRKRALLKEYWRYIMDEMHLVAVSSYKGTEKKQAEQAAMREVASALKGSDNVVLQTWGESGATAAWLAGWIMCLVPFGVFLVIKLASAAEYLHLPYLGWGIVTLNMIFCGVAAFRLYKTLVASTEKMPSRTEKEGELLDNSLNGALIGIRSRHQNSQKN